MAATDKIKMDLSNVDECFPADFTEEQKAEAKTAFYKELAEVAHRFYGGKMQTVPKAGLFGFNWFNAWCTPLVCLACRPPSVTTTTSRCS